MFCVNQVDITPADALAGSSCLCRHAISNHDTDYSIYMSYNIDGLVQGRRNSSALAMELCLSCINPSI